MADLKRARSLIGPILKYGLLAVILVWFLTSGRLRFDLFIPSAHWLPAICLGAVLALASMTCAGIRCGVALRAVDVPCGRLTALKAGFIGFFFTYCTLGTLSGDVMRGVFISRHCPNMGDKITAAIVVDRVLGLLSLVTMCGFALYLGMSLDIPHGLRQGFGVVLLLFLFCVAGLSGLLSLQLLRLPGFLADCLAMGGVILVLNRGLALSGNWPLHVNFALSALACAALGLAGAFLVSRLSLTPLAENRFVAPGTLGGKTVGMVRVLLAFRDSPKAILSLFGLALCQHVLAILAIHRLAGGLSLPEYPALAQVFFSAPLTFVFSIVPLPGAGVGVHEMAFGTLLAASAPALGAAKAGGANIYLLFRMVMTCLSFIGIPFYLGMKKRPARDKDGI